ncbi:MAG: glycosyltransferase family 4 protein [Armatimonadetes bacterium]|nr:glycosyltransferase family 4 protein [Armatimonadota bacterium]
MKIGMFSDCYLPMINGVVRAIVTFKNCLEKLGDEIFVFAPQVPKFKEIDSKVFRFFSAPFLFQKEYRISFPFPINYLNKVKLLNLDLIHIHSPFFMGFLGIYLAKKYQLPLIFTHHTRWEEYTHYIPILSSNILRKIALKQEKYFCESSNKVIAPTFKIKELLEKRGINGKIQVISAGIELEKFKLGEKEKVFQHFNFLKGNKILFYAGRLAKEKGIDFLLDCFSLILMRFPKTYFLLAGDGPYRKFLEKKAENLNLKDRIIFLGYLKIEELIDYYTAACVFLFSSFTETQGLVVQEALACGCPVVAVKAPGTDEAVIDGFNGFLTSFNKEEFSARVLEILQNPQKRETFSQNALKDSEKFSIILKAKELQEVYKKTIKEKNINSA